MQFFNRLSQWPDEIWQAVYAIAWGFWLLLPFTTFNTFQTWDFLNSLMPESAWGVGTIVFASASIVLTKQRQPYARVAANALLAPGWVFMAWVAIVSTPPATIGALLAVLGLHQLVLLVDAIGEAVRVAHE